MAYINSDSGIVAIPLILLAMLLLGVCCPVYDFLKDRRAAAMQQKPMPGADILLRNFKESQFLSYFLFFMGIIYLVSGLFPFFAPSNVTPMAFVRLFAGIVIGAVLMFTAQKMQRRFDNRMRGWRKNINSSANHGLESTGAPPRVAEAMQGKPAAGTPETHF